MTKQTDAPTTLPRKRPVIRDESRKAIRAWIWQSAAGIAGYGALICLAAGRLDWLWGWVLVAVLGGVLAAHPLILIPINPELLVERQRGLRDPRVKKWDRWVAAFAAGIFPMAGWIVAGLDTRLGWSGDLPLAIHLIGTACVVLGFALFLWAMAANAFFSEGVRIQTERGHTVATKGPYRFVRHPGYVGAILAEAATPLLLGSLWAIVPALGSVVCYVIRTFLEDRTLTEELKEYETYARSTRHRLLPGLW